MEVICKLVKTDPLHLFLTQLILLGLRSTSALFLLRDISAMDI
ncbi:unnamed protein product [Musa banksii]